MKLMGVLLATATAAADLTGSTAGHAEVIRIDLQGNASGGGFEYLDYTGVEEQAAAADARFGSDGTDAWNHLSVASYPIYTSNPSFAGLVGSAGHPTGVAFSLEGLTTTASDNPLDADGSNALQNDYLVVLGTATIGYTISGLPADTLVSFVNYSPTFGAGGRGYDLTANGISAHVGTPTENMVITSIWSSATGTILGTFTTRNGEGDWSGFQLAYATAAIPEPQAWGMMILGFGMVAEAIRRRRGNMTVRFA